MGANKAWPYFEKDEVDAAARVLHSGKVNYWTGTEGREFEREFARYCGARRAIALANGTVALEIALRLLGIGPGDEVIVAPRSFVASASCIMICGAKPVFADVDRDSQNITAESVRRVLTPRTKAIIAVHLAGWPCDMDELRTVADGHGLKLVEDCAQAHGALYKGKMVGTLGDAAAFSFCQDKIMTTAGEGGMLVMNDEELWFRAWSYKDHGKSMEALTPAGSPGFRWLHESLGTNFRLSEVQSAVGRLQLAKLPRWLDRRRSNATILTSRLGKISSLRVTPPPSDISHSYYKYYVFVRPEELKSGWTRNRILQEINQGGVTAQMGSCSEIYMEKLFDSPGLRPTTRLPNARELGDTAIMFLVHPTLDGEDMERTCLTVENVMEQASR